MGRRAIEVDRELLAAAVAKAEKGGPLATQKHLWMAVAENYNKNKGVAPIQYGVVMLRVQEWGIPIKTQPARKVTPREAAPEPEPEPVRVATDPPPARPGSTYRSATVPVAIPSGEPPFALKDFSPESVAEWCDKTSDEMLKRGFKLLPSAICYYLRAFIDVNDKSRKYNQVCEIIHNHYGSTFAEPL